MKMLPVLNGQVSDLRTKYENVFDYDFEAENATPFPLQAVLAQLYIAEILADDISLKADTMELAVLFADTFGDSIPVTAVKDAQERADERINNADDLDIARQTVAMQELVAAYGRHYAYNRSSFHRQYDAVKWYTTIGLHELGLVLENAAKRAAPRVRSAFDRARNAFRARIPGVSQPEQETTGTPATKAD